MKRAAIALPFCNRRLALVSAAVLTLVGVLAFTYIDVLILEAIQTLPHNFRYALTYVTEFGKSEYYLVPALVIALFGWWRSKQATLLCARARSAYYAAIGLYVFAAVAISGVAGNVLKFVIGRARPKEWLEQGAYGFDPFTLASRWHSFPSGHANTMTAAVIALVPFVPAAWRLPLAAVAGFITASRCIVAAHYVSDILGGALVAALVCHVLQQQVQTRFRLPFCLLKKAA